MAVQDRLPDTDALRRRLDEGRRAAPMRLRAGLPVLLALAVVSLYPLYVDDLAQIAYIGSYFPIMSTAVVMLIFMMMSVSLNIVVGYAGLLDLGYVAFYAAGAYMAAWLASRQFNQVTFHLGAVGLDESVPGIHISIWLVLIAAGIFTAVVGVLIGLPTLRLRGDYLAIVTLGFGEIIPEIVRNGDSLRGFDLTHGAFGVSPIDSPGFGEGLQSTLGLPGSFQQSFDRERLFFWSALALLLITCFVSVRLRDSRLGRAWVAIREDETAAAAMGIPLMRTKTWAYACGAFFGGIAGAYFASFRGGAFPSDFIFQISVFILCMVILGGMGSVWGAVVGGAVLAWLNFQGLSNIGASLSNALDRNVDIGKYAFSIYGAILVIVMLFRPTGLITERRHKAELAEPILAGGVSPVTDAPMEPARPRDPAGGPRPE
jgi:branched-chain amino acid transport system permease protein